MTLPGVAYPKGLPKGLRTHWDHPWRRRARLSPSFRRWLESHGYFTPHFKKAEARCKDPQRSPVPASLNRRCRDHAFNLERLRHRLGDKPLPIVSWYRTPAWNKHVGGASQSKHMQAFATDHPKEWIDRAGRDRVFREADVVFANGGVGRYPGGAAHFDSRGVRARWSWW